MLALNNCRLGGGFPYQSYCSLTPIPWEGGGGFLNKPPHRVHRMEKGRICFTSLLLVKGLFDSKISISATSYASFPLNDKPGWLLQITWLGKLHLKKQKNFACTENDLGGKWFGITIISVYHSRLGGSLLVLLCCYSVRAWKWVWVVLRRFWAHVGRAGGLGWDWWVNHVMGKESCPNWLNYLQDRFRKVISFNHSDQKVIIFGTPPSHS